jgi:hypothetical protein
VNWASLYVDILVGLLIAGAPAERCDARRHERAESPYRLRHSRSTLDAERNDGGDGR